jgi:ribonuclease G
MTCTHPGCAASPPPDVMDEIRVQTSPGERRIALLRGGVLTAYAIWRPFAPDGLGDLHRARVIARVPALAGSFVALAGAEAFLPDSACEVPVTQGQMLTVRVVRSAQSGKGPRVSARACPESQGDSEGDVRHLAPGPTVLQRLAAAAPGADILVESPALLAELRQAHGARLRLVHPVFDDALEADIAALASPAVALPGGLRASITHTPALTAIDVDTGTATAARREKSAAHVAANLAAIPELTRQIRLRNIPGAILIDFAGLTPRRRHALGPTLAEALAADPQKPRLIGFTGLGLAEILRPRGAPPLHELLRGPHAAGLAALRLASAVCARAPARLLASPAVISALHADRAALRELAAGTVHPLMLVSDPSRTDPNWTLEDMSEARLG